VWLKQLGVEALAGFSHLKAPLPKSFLPDPKEFVEKRNRSGEQKALRFPFWRDVTLPHKELREIMV
jgi:hypothetical protein